MTGRTLIRWIILLATVAFPARVSGEPVEDFYKGKQIRLIVGSSPGDGYHLWSRLIAGHLLRHVPGRPGIVLQNMPGSGTITATNHLFGVAAKDGTAFGSFSRSLPSQALL